MSDEQERKPYPKYQECPCGSGKKYKFCCFTKGFHYYIDAAGGTNVRKEVPISAEVSELLTQHKANQEEKLGRPVCPDDLIFPELAALGEENFKAQMAAELRKMGIRPVLIYAFEKTGLLVSETNKHLIPDVDLAEWDAAVEEYYELHPEEDLRTT
jgi:hypothetical protein